MKFSKKNNILCIIHCDFLEFKLNLAFFQLFMFELTKNKNFWNLQTQNLYSI